MLYLRVCFFRALISARRNRRRIQLVVGSLKVLHMQKTKTVKNNMNNMQTARYVLFLRLGQMKEAWF